MKILELHYSTSWAGAERFVVDLSNELTLNNQVILCTINDDKIKDNSYYKKELSHAIKYLNLGCKSGLQIKSLWRILQIVIKEKPDIVHAHTDLICLFLPSLICRKAKYFHTLHNLAEICLSKLYLKSIYKWFYKHKIVPITISKKCQQSYEKLYELNNAACINNGRSPLHTTTTYPEVKKEIDSLKLNKDDKIFLHVARCDKQKNQVLLIDAFNKFLSKGHHGILIIIGADYDTPDNKNLLEKTSQGIYWLGVKDNVCDYLRCADFFVLSSLWEGLPISLLEALSCGVIPICTPAGGIVDVIKNEQIGFVSKDFSFESFYYIMEKAYIKENTFNRFILIDYFNKNFSMAHCASLYLQLFRKYDR